MSIGIILSSVLASWGSSENPLRELRVRSEKHRSDINPPNKRTVYKGDRTLEKI